MIIKSFTAKTIFNYHLWRCAGNEVKIENFEKSTMNTNKTTLNMNVMVYIRTKDLIMYFFIIEAILNYIHR